MDVASLNFGKLKLRPHGKVYSCIMFCFLKETMVYIERMVYTCLLNMKSNLFTSQIKQKNSLYSLTNTFCLLITKKVYLSLNSKLYFVMH